MEEQNAFAMMNGFHDSGIDDAPSESSTNTDYGVVTPPLEEEAVTPPPEGEASPTSGRTLTSRESSRLIGSVKWFNAKAGYGFITRRDTGEDIFIHHSGIGRKNPRHAIKSLGDGELVEFNLSATNVTGVGGRPVRGNPYVSNLPPIRRSLERNDSFASGDQIGTLPRRRYFRPVDGGNSRIPRFIPYW